MKISRILFRMRQKL